MSEELLSVIVEIGHPATTKLVHRVAMEIPVGENQQEIAGAEAKKVRKFVAENSFEIGFSHGVAWIPSELYWAVFTYENDGPDELLVAHPSYFSRVKPQTNDERESEAFNEKYAAESYAEMDAELEQIFNEEMEATFNENPSQLNGNIS